MRHMASFPRHFHDGRDEVVAESPLGDNPVEDVRHFLSFIRSKLEE